MRKRGSIMRMSRRPIAIVVSVLLVITLVVSYFLFFYEPNITTPPEEMILGEDAFPEGWKKTDSKIEYYPGPGANWWAWTYFSNTSPRLVHEDAIVLLIAYNSSSIAHDNYMGSLRASNINATSIDVGDEGYLRSWGNIESPAYACCAFRINNILVEISFSHYSEWSQFQPNPYQSWMDDIARRQASMIH
jgi:hypothetical protein